MACARLYRSLGQVKRGVGLLLRSLVASRGLGKKDPGHTPRCHTHPSQARCQVWLQTAGVLSSLPRGGPRHAGGCSAGIFRRAGGRGGGPRPQQRRGGGWRALVRAGANALAWGQRRVPRTGRQGSAWSGGSGSCTMACSAYAALRGGVWRGPVAVVGAVGSARHTTGGIALPGRRAGHGGVRRPPSLCQVPCQRPSPAVSRAWWHPAAQGVPRWVAAVGHRDGRVPASVPSNPTKHWSRPRQW